MNVYYWNTPTILTNNHVLKIKIALDFNFKGIGKEKKNPIDAIDSDIVKIMEFYEYPIL